MKVDWNPLIRIATLLLACVALLIALGLTGRPDLPCYSAPAPLFEEAPEPASTLKISTRNFIPDLNPADMLAFNDAFGVLSRDFWGCRPSETDIRKCVFEAGGTNGDAWRRARPLAASIWNLREK